VSPARILFLAVGAAIFALWAIQMYRALFRVWRRGMARTGKTLPGPLDALKDWGTFMTGPDDAATRRWLVLTMLAMFAWIAAAATLLPT